MRSTLILFDLDDTLLITNTRILLRDPISKEILHTLKTSELRTWCDNNNLDDYLVDFSEFTSIEKVTKSFLEAIPGPGLPLLKEAIRDKNTEIGILTARSSEIAVRIALPHFFEKQNIRVTIDPTLIFAVRDPKYIFPKELTDSERKLHIILQLIKEEIFESVILVDDDPMHRKVINNYCKKHRIKNVKTLHVLA